MERGQELTENSAKGGSSCSLMLVFAWIASCPPNNLFRSKIPRGQLIVTPDHGKPDSVKKWKSQHCPANSSPSRPIAQNLVATPALQLIFFFMRVTCHRSLLLLAS